jgi:hypothetical protein
MIEPQEVQDGGMRVVNMDAVLHGAEAQLVGGAVGQAAPHTAVGQPLREPQWLWSRPSPD